MIRWLPPQAWTIPVELREQPYVLWRAEPRGEDKPAKVPYQIAWPSRKASSTDPTTWGTFDDAVEAYLSLAEEPADPVRGPIVGVGVVLVRGAEITCIDLDRVIEPDGPLDQQAEALVHRVNSWTEISPSGLGIHIFVRGSVTRAIKGDQIEVYSEARYIAITGWTWPGMPGRLEARQHHLDALAQTEIPPTIRRPYTGPSAVVPDDLAGALLAKLARWGVHASQTKRWQDGHLVELETCPWASTHTTGSGGAAVMIRASGAFDFTCLHAHCSGRGWADFRAAMEGRSV